MRRRCAQHSFARAREISLRRAPPRPVPQVLGRSVGDRREPPDAREISSWAPRTSACRMRACASKAGGGRPSRRIEYPRLARVPEARSRVPEAVAGRPVGRASAMESAEQTRAARRAQGGAPSNPNPNPSPSPSPSPKPDPTLTLTLTLALTLSLTLTLTRTLRPGRRAGSSAGERHCRPRPIAALGPRCAPG